MKTNTPHRNSTILMAAICLLTLIPAVRAADLALKFDGTNEFVTFGTAPGLGASNFTLEVWFMRQGAGLSNNTGTGGIFITPLLGKGRNEVDNNDNRDMNYLLGIATNNVLAADFETFVGGTNKPVTGVTKILNDVWYHAAVTYNGTNWALYLNDSLEISSTVGAGVFPRYDSIQHAGLATSMNSTGQPAGFFAGTLDEARIWNYARTQQQIHDSIRTAITNAQTGLLGRWGLDENGGNIASNSAAPAITGILSNGPTRVAGYPFALAGVGGLYFDGTNDYVTFGPTNALGLSTFTIETWFKRTGTGIVAETGALGVFAIPLVTKGRHESDGSNVDMNYFLGIGTNNNTTVLCADFEQLAGGTNNPVMGVTPIANDVWYHAAATYDGSNWRLYLNGVLETNVFVGQTPRFDSIQHAGLGTAMDSTGAPEGAFQGVLDEVRIWNYARSASQILNNKTNAIPSETGLVARMGLDEEWGIVAGNTGSSGVDGALTNGPTWVAGQVLSQPGMGALHFDGNNEYVTFGSGGGLGLSTFTIETWFRRDGTGIAVNTGAGGLDAIPLVTKGRHESDGSNVDMNYFFGIRTNDNKLCADFEQLAGGTNNPVVGVTPIANDVWYHAAATYDGSNWRLYLNGVLETNVFVGQTPRFDSIQHAGLGTAMDSTGAPEGFFNGALEEVRIWNYARSASEIQSNKDYRVQGAIGLVGRWGLDQTSGLVASNTALGGVHGSLINGPFWTAGYPLATISNAAPTTPVLVSPANNATGVLSAVTLSASVTDTDSTTLAVTFYGCLVGQTAGSDFTIIAMPDTQYYASSLNGGTPAMFTAQTDWIVSNRVSRNIVFVTHEGDCVEHGDDFEAEWINATNSMYRLENPLTTGLLQGIPYGIAPGNHDQTANGDPNGTTTFYNKYFGTNHFAGRTYYGGHASTNNDSHFELFSAGGMDFVILHLEYGDTSPALLSWANSVMQTYSNRRAIVTSHNIIQTNGSYDVQGQVRYDALKANTNWFLALCGHVSGEGRRQDTFAGNTVNTLLADYQSRVNGGNGWMRILDFSPANNLISVKTYSPVLNQFETDADSQFTLSYNMAGSGSGFSVIGVSNNVPSGSTPTMLWSGLQPGTNYEWYVTVSDGLHTVSSATNHFSTAPSSVSGNLVAAYTFDEGTGTSVADSSGYANNGTTSSTTWTNAGKYGKALVFNGTSSVVNVNDSPSLRLTTAMTLEAWVYPTVAVSSWKDIVYKGDDNYFLMAGSTPFNYPAVGGIFGGNNVATPGLATLPINTWTHLAGTYDGSTLRLYTNGLLVSSLAQSGNILTSANPLQIGGDNFYSDQHFQGRIDDVRVYNVALSGSQIVSDMNTPVGTTPPDSDSDGLLDSWEMTYFSTLSYGATDDPDGDGLNNQQEFQAGTNPNSSASALRITAVTRESNSLRVTWITAPNKTNALQRTAGGAGGSYSNNFVDIFTVTNTVGSVTNYLDSGAATNKPARYYRVRLVP